MQVVLDTNVCVSGIFYSGPPYEILNAWRRGTLDLVVSLDILTEYYRVGGELARRFPGGALRPVLDLLAVRGQIVHAFPLPERVCTDPDDDKFLGCALSSGTKIVVSGDKSLRRVSGYLGIRVLSPREFVDARLGKEGQPA